MFKKIVKISMDCFPDNKNPDCILNALVYPKNKNLKSSGLGRDFSLAHDGRHVRGVDKEEGTIITLAPLTGTVVYLILRLVGRPQ